MNVGELIQELQRAVKAGRLHELDDVMVRNTAVSEAAMEAGSDGYLPLDEVLIVTGSPGAAHLLLDES